MPSLDKTPGPNFTSDKSLAGSLSVTLKIVGAAVTGDVKIRVIVPVGPCPFRSGQLPPPLFPLYSRTQLPGSGPPPTSPPQLSLIVAVPNAALISPADGLQPNVVVVPVVVITGGILSAIQVTVLDAMAELPHASLAVHALV